MCTVVSNSSIIAYFEWIKLNTVLKKKLLLSVSGQ